MILGFYYHIVVYQHQGKIYLPEYLGVFVDELAKQSETLYYFAYTSINKTDEQNYLLKQNNIQLVDLGRKKIFPATVLTGYFLLRKLQKWAGVCDAILVRAPSPLAPWFYFAYRNVTRINFLMVGDYMEGIKHQDFPFIKQKLINTFTIINESMQNHAIRHLGCLVNSIPLFEKYRKFNANVKLVKTTTLKADSFFYREDTCTNPADIKLLFVGRIEKAKGMDELIAAFERLLKDSYKVSLHLAGWDTQDAQEYFSRLNKNELTKSHWKYHGLLNGNDLMNLYRKSDILVLPSHHEGFPRVIWEAMANSVPVIATHVGGIPHTIKNGLEAILITPKQSEELFNAIIDLMKNSDQRKEMITNSRLFVSDLNIEHQVKNIIDFVYE